MSELRERHYRQLYHHYYWLLDQKKREEKAADKNKVQIETDNKLEAYYEPTKNKRPWQV